MTPERPTSWGRAKRVLCVRPDGMGDVLMTTPALRALAGDPVQRHLTLLASPAGRALADLVPEVAETLVYDAPWVKGGPETGDGRQDDAMIARLRAGRFDAAVIFTVYSQNPLPAALMCRLAGIPLRLAHCRENPYRLLTDWVPDTEPGTGVRHEVRRQLDLVAAAGFRTGDQRLSINVPAGAHARADALLTDLGLDPERPWIVLHPGATAASRRYPPESFAAVTRQLVQEHGLQVVFTGSEPERKLVEDTRHAAGVPSLSLAGCLDLAGMAALLARAPLLLTNNTGPAHLAAAVGTPVVDLYALTNPQHTPWGVPSRVLFHDVPCRYCLKSVCPEGHHHCLRGIEPQEVVAAVLDLLGAAPACRLATPLPALEAPGPRAGATLYLAAPRQTPGVNSRQRGGSADHEHESIGRGA
ncbi:MAG TPA: lipopolysaccharide heptosyltransferase II [Trueperaceae bacterium]